MNAVVFKFNFFGKSSSHTPLNHHYQFLTCFDHHQMQRVVPNVGHCSYVVDGHPQDDVFSIPPHQFDVVGWQTHHCVLLWRQLACQLMGFLRSKGDVELAPIRTNHKYYIRPSRPKILTLAVSMSCSISVRLDGFKYPGTDVSCPKYCKTE